MQEDVNNNNNNNNNNNVFVTALNNDERDVTIVIIRFRNRSAKHGSLPRHDFHHQDNRVSQMTLQPDIADKLKLKKGKNSI